MDKDKIRLAIATDLRGKPSRNSASLMPTIAGELHIDVTEVYNQVSQMSDIGHIVQRNETSLRMTDDGERFYFSTGKERVSTFLQRNWPHVTSNLLALIAIVISLCALLSHSG